jgi:hypothetical protein
MSHVRGKGLRAMLGLPDPRLDGNEVDHIEHLGAVVATFVQKMRSVNCLMRRHRHSMQEYG